MIYRRKTITTAKILLVDDDPMLIDMYKERLEAANYKVILARNSEEALAQVEQKKLDLILLDLMMPKINGYELLKRLKSREKTKKIPVIIMTAIIPETNKIEGLEAGADDYFIKSETIPREVITRVAKVLIKKI